MNAFEKNKNLKIGVGILIVLVISFVPLIKKEYEILKLQRILSDVTINSILVGGRNFSVKNGLVPENTDQDTKLKVLRLAAFYQWNKEDPLFYSPDLNTSSVRVSLNLLNAAQDNLLSVTHEAQPLFPIPYLKLLTDITEKNESFLNNPSDLSAQGLLEIQRAGANAYTQSAQSFVNFEKSASPLYSVMFNTQTSNGIVLDDYQLIVQNGQALEQEIVKREACLEGTGSCIKPLASLAVPKFQSFAVTEKPVLIDKKFLDLHFLNQSSEIDQSGPYRASTSCFGWGNNFSSPEYYFYVTKLPPESWSLKYPESEVVLATNVFFKRLSSPDKLIYEPAEAFLSSQGQKYIAQPSYTPYLCLSSNYIPEVFEVDLFIKNKKPILQNTNAPNDAKLEEEAFFNDPYPSYQELANLGNFYGYLYEQNSLSGIRDELLSRYLMIENKMGSFESLMAYNIPFTLRMTTLEQLKPFGHEYSLDYLYPLRSNYALMYQTFAPSVWRLDKSPQFMEKRDVLNAVSPQGGYISYTQATKIYFEQEIESWFIDVNPILAQLGKAMSSK